MKRRLNEVYVKHTGQSYDVIERTLDRDYFMTAEQAQEFGLIDKVLIEPRAGRFRRDRRQKRYPETLSNKAERPQGPALLLPRGAGRAMLIGLRSSWRATELIQRTVRSPQNCGNRAASR